MNIQEVKTLEEANAIVEPLMAENKWAITVAQRADGVFVIKWMEHKMYTAQDGKEYRDEVWTTYDGEMKLIQDLEPEHARNIIRMMLRQEREAKAAMEGLYEQLAERIAAGFDESDEDTPSDNQVPPNTLLH
jgi:hypothetical protein